MRGWVCLKGKEREGRESERVGVLEGEGERVGRVRGWGCV